MSVWFKIGATLFLWFVVVPLLVMFMTMLGGVGTPELGILGLAFIVAVIAIWMQPGKVRP